jgi:uncharacterized protein (DUF885 family)
VKLDRRAMLGGMAAVSVARPARAQQDLRAALDAAVRDATAQAALDRLAWFDAGVFAGGDRLDLITARAGLAVDAELARRFPFGRGFRPYRVTPFDGAWRGSDPVAIDADTRAIEKDAQAGVMLPRPWLERTIAAISAGKGAQEARQRQVEVLSSLLARSPARQGLGQVPDGERWFILLCARTSGMPASMAQCERRLLAEKDRLQARALDLFARLGMRQGSAGARFQTLWRDPAQLYTDTAQAVADMNRMLAVLRGRVIDVVGPVPGWCLDVSARSLTDQEIAQGRKGYRQVPTPDRPGAYIVDLRNLGLRPRWTLPAVVAHELLPGHMIQLGLEALHPPHPLRQTYAAAFVEGWGIYAEQLGDYPDTLGELGQVHWHLFRVGRALVDIGIHLHGWSHEEARDRLLEWQGVAAYFAPFDDDLDRIALEPGLRLGEALSWLAIRDGAKGRHGDALRAFHRDMVTGGLRRTEAIAAAPPRN